MSSALYGDGDTEEARFRADVDLAADLIVADAQQVSDASLAATLGVDRTTLAKHRERFGLTIGEIRSAALRRHLLRDRQSVRA
jgi:hypothetical protein